MPDWPRRIFTLTAGCSVTMYLLQFHVPAWAFLSLFSMAASYEYRTVIVPQNVKHLGGDPAVLLLPSGVWMAGAAIVQTSSLLMNCDVVTFTTWMVIVALASLHVLSYSQTHAPSHISLAALGLELFGIFYVPWSLAHLQLIRALPNGNALELLLAFTVWNADNGAIVMGVAFGRTPLLPAVSPNKTRAGFVGALLLGTMTPVIGWCLVQFNTKFFIGLLPDLSLLVYIVTGLAVSLLAVMGDLVESVMKRAARVKDSGTVIPGQGGALDRMDSLLLAAPALYYAYKLAI